MGAEEKLEKANEKLKAIELRLLKKVNNGGKYISSVKNSHLHIIIESHILNKLKREAQEEGLSLAGWCRKKLRDDSQLDRIERKLDNLCKS